MPEDSNPALMGLTREEVNVAMKDADHLKRWLAATGRRWLVLSSDDLVDALWDVPDAVNTLIGLLAMYRDHRRGIPNGRTETMTEPATKTKVQVPLMKDEALELEELDRAIRALIGQASREADRLGVAWSLESAPL